MNDFADSDEMTEKQKRILAAAAELFAERGYAGAATSEIAKRAGVAEGTIFRHYKTKKDLLLAVVAPVFRKILAPRLLAEIVEIWQHPYENFGDLLRAILYNRLDFVKTHIGLLRIVLQEVPFHDDLREQVKETLGVLLYPSIAAGIERYQAKGQILDLPTNTVLRFIVSNLLSYFLTRFFLFPESAWNDDKDIEEIILLVTRALRPA